MPKEGRLDPSKTFKSQQEFVTRTIIFTIKQLIDFTVYPVNENILYQIIYRRHRSQRDTYQINNKELEEKKRNQKETQKHTLVREKAKKNENDQQSKKQ
ncbi:hypothetical protein GLOIN_2v1486197 [Rhizophagus irregularis DAOM 181602=DAOM 197198]|nr:hypothetical protein GLOIN_2v1486197 [Rhizophagus irregularis DAOM 181602=DAOM 197198]